ncbi:hypothetical protein CCACVL1_25499 [Corchorus capsularis]|uniref:Uncharacterized protein n=1 Tax=Corchorus capsularis TaxID=210143 RepID=A0A1R3GJP1_COCAP|nr:hypothetical protein CCACVL1_25499 [Corchorus capsularis]
MVAPGKHDALKLGASMYSK